MVYCLEHNPMAATQYLPAMKQFTLTFDIESARDHLLAEDFRDIHNEIDEHYFRFIEAGWQALMIETKGAIEMHFCFEHDALVKRVEQLDDSVGSTLTNLFGHVFKQSFDARMAKERNRLESEMSEDFEAIKDLPYVDVEVRDGLAVKTVSEVQPN